MLIGACAARRWLKQVLGLSVADPIVLIVGRLSGPKNEVILSILRNVAPKVVQKVPRAKFMVVGGPVAEEHALLEKKFPYITFAGHQKNLNFFYRKAALVVGAGRVALEAMALGKPVLAVGERLYVGPILPEQIELAKTTNFGDCFDKESFDWARMGRDMTNLLQSKSLRAKASQTGTSLVRAEYDMEKIYPRLESLYQKVFVEKNVSRFPEIPVLMYHRVVAKEPAYSKFNLHVTQTDLEKQLLFLKVRGFQPITFEDLLIRRAPSKPVILTFDDGYEDNYHCLFPLLKKHQMKAVVYLLGNRKPKTNFWDTPQGEPEVPLLKPNQILEMSHSGLVEFGAHSLNHRKLTELKGPEIEKEVAGSKAALEAFLKKPVVSFAYPYGLVNEEIKQITLASGYTFGVAVNSGPTRFGGDLMEIRRVHMFPRTSILEFFKKTSGYYLRYRKLLGK